MNGTGFISQTPQPSMSAATEGIQRQNPMVEDSNLPEVVYSNNPGDKYVVTTQHKKERIGKIKGIQRQYPTLEDSNLPEVAYSNNPGDKYVVTTQHKRGSIAKIKVLWGNKYPAHVRSICGLRRKIFWIVLSTILVVIGAVIGGTVGSVKRKKPLESLDHRPVDGANSSTTVFDNKTTLLGTSLTATTYFNENRLFYQDQGKGIHHVYCPSNDCAGRGSTDDLITEISDAKLHSPLAAADNYTEVYLYYFNEDNYLREKIWYRSNNSWTDGSLNQLAISADERSDLAVIRLDYDKQIRLYYQPSDGHIHEVSFSANLETWIPCGNITEEAAAPATKIAAAAWDFGGSESTYVRVYYQTTKLKLTERATVPGKLWFNGFTDGDIITLSLGSSLGAAGEPSLAVFTTSQNEEIYSYSVSEGTWGWGSPIIVAKVHNYTYPIAVTQWASEKRIWILYQGENSSINVVDSFDGGKTWGVAKVVSNLSTS